MSNYPYPAFSGYGIEIEHMIVDAHTLEVRPIADQLLRSSGGDYELEVDRGEALWSNELALHVIEMKTAGISQDLADTRALFRREVNELNSRLRNFGARLLPGGMHPFMDPERELRLWPHENDVIYKTFDRIFDCRGHGWANLQSVHVNLPFQNDAEFARVHAACRVVLPLLPALAASSPFIEGHSAPHLDQRVEVYRHNARRIPSVTGHVIPERVFSRAEYESELLGPIYEDLRPLDPEGILQEEWVNARGAIARFDRGAIEIRLLDTQECPEQDLAVVALVTRLVEALAREEFAPLEELESFSEQELESILLPTIRDASRARVTHRAYLDLFGIHSDRLEARELWQALAERVLPSSHFARTSLDVYFRMGSLAERLVQALPPTATSPLPRELLLERYTRLADCLAQGQIFRP